MARAFKPTKATTAAGWLLGVGDALRGAGNCVSVLMLSPTAPAFQTSPGAMWRAVIGKRVCRLERRIHATPTGRCSRGRWERLDTGDTPTTPAQWRKLSEFWAWYAAEYADGRIPAYDWATDPGKSRNLCRTLANANAPNPTMGSATPGRGRRGKGQPSKLEAFGWSPAAGYRVAQTPRDARAERLDRMRRNRRARGSCPECDQFGRHSSHSPGCPRGDK
jgi:hypothetical protein